MNERQHGTRFILFARLVCQTDVSDVLHIHRCACIAVLLTRGHQFEVDITSQPRRLHMVFILESPYQDLDVVESVTVFVWDKPQFVYHLLDIFTLVSAHERLSAQCVIEFWWRWKVPLSRLGSFCMEQICAERALEKSLYIALRNIRGIYVLFLQSLIHVLQHQLVVFDTTVFR